MKTAYQLLAIIAHYSDIANTFNAHFGYGIVFCGHRAPSGRLYFIAAHGGA